MLVEAKGLVKIYAQDSSQIFHVHSRKSMSGLHVLECFQ